MTYVRCAQASMWLFMQVVEIYSRKILAKFHTAVISRQCVERLLQMLTIRIQVV